MEKLTRPEFAYLFIKTFDQYRDSLSAKGIPHPTKQMSILGYGVASRINEKLGVCSENCSLSHFVYFDLKKKKYPFQSNGIPTIIDGNHLQLQGGELQNAYHEYNNGYDKVSLSSTYLKIYLAYLGKTKKELTDLSADFDNVPPHLVIPFSTPKRRSGKNELVRGTGRPKFEIEHDIYLAAPILTLRMKIRENYRNFKDDLEKLLTKYLADEVEKLSKTDFFEDLENKLIDHFFGFPASDLEQELTDFQNHFVSLKTHLEGLGLKVFDSREEITKGKTPPIVQSQVRLLNDIEAIRKSSAYVLLSPYPRLFSSAWVEAGAAIDMKKPCLFICTNRKTDLPFVLQERSGSLHFDVFDNWNSIVNSLEENKWETYAKGIETWYESKTLTI